MRSQTLQVGVAVDLPVKNAHELANPALISVATAVRQVEADAAALVRAAVDQLYLLKPDLRSQYGPKGVQACYDDSIRHLNFLIAAVQNGSPSSYVDYVSEAASVLQTRHMDEGLTELLELIGQRIRARHGEPVWRCFQPTLDTALMALQTSPLAENARLESLPSGSLMTLYLEAVRKANRLAAQRLILSAFQSGTSLQEIYVDVFQPALYEIGRLWQAGLVSVAEEHLVTGITEMLMDLLFAKMPPEKSNGKRALIACLSSNYHEVGPRMLADFLRLAGYETVFLGANTPEKNLLSLVDEQRPDLIGLPASLDLHVERVRGTIDILRSDFASYAPVVMVGGQAFNRVEGLWKQVGADVWGEDARQALNNLEGAKGH